MFPHIDARPEDSLPFAAQRLAERAEAQVRRVAGIIELRVKTGAPARSTRIARRSSCGAPGAG